MSAARRLADPGSGFAAKLIVLAAAGLALRLVYGFSLNDPSGDATPSESDIRLTRRLSEGARILQISMLDHVIVGQPFGGLPGRVE